MLELAATASWEIVARTAVHAAQEALAEHDRIADAVRLGDAGPTVLMWRSRPALVVSRSDSHLPHFTAAAASLQERGWPVVVRASGGGAFALGPGTVQAAMISIYPDGATSIDRVYDGLAAPLRAVLATYGIATEIRHGAGAFCPGRHDILVAGRKIAGTAQHWRPANPGRCIVATAALLVDEDVAVLADVVNDFYQRAGAAFRCCAEAATTLRAHLSRRDAESDLSAAVMTRLGEAWSDAPVGLR